jgi:catechol 2,3-dioxygenase-like lactoylglutathione lyase family enzyme
MAGSGNILQATSVMSVPDLDRAVGFFRDLLGFKVWVNDGGYAYLSRDGCGIRLLDFAAAGASPPGTRRFGHYFDVRDVDSIAAEVAVRLPQWPDVDVHGPVNQSYGQREFCVLAPDGDLVVFGQAINSDGPTP